MKMIKLATVCVLAGAMTGCADYGKEISALQADVDAIKAQVSSAQSDAAAAKASASAAEARAAAAESAANSAARYAEDTNSKLDRMFKKSMMK